MAAEADDVSGSRARGDAGHRVYTRPFLKLYDPLVLWLYSNRVWRCPVRRLVDLYSANVRQRHLDVGPGTGYFLSQARPPYDVHLTLLDPNAQVLRHASAAWRSSTRPSSKPMSANAFRVSGRSTRQR